MMHDAWDVGWVVYRKGDSEIRRVSPFSTLDV